MRTLVRTLLTCTLAAAAGGAWAQGGSPTSPIDATTPPGAAGGPVAGAFPLSDFDAVNVFNGNLSIHLPLLAVGGRGEAGYTVTMPLNSKRWRVSVVCPPQQPDCLHLPNRFSTIDDDPKVDYGPGTLELRYAVTNPLTGGSCPQTPQPTALTRVVFTAPDGRELAFRDAAAQGQPRSATCQGGNWTPFLRGSVFVSIDGAAATYESDTPIYDCLQAACDNFQPPSGRLRFRDGTTYRIVDKKVAWIRDRNGNRLELTQEPEFGRTTLIRDSLNREVTISYAYPSGGPYDEIAYKGFGGADRFIRIWKDTLGNSLREDHSLQTLRQLFPDLDGNNVNLYDPAGLVKAVELPDGRTYEFRYSAHREVALVELPTGGSFEYDYVPDYTRTGQGTEYLAGRRVSERRVYDTGHSLVGLTTYAASYPQGGTEVQVEDHDGEGGLLSRRKHFFFGDPRFGPLSPLSDPFWLEGKEHRTEVLDASSSPLRTTEHTWDRPSVPWWTGPRIANTRTTLDNGLVSLVGFLYDTYNNVTLREEQDYGAGSPGGRLRRTETDYVVSNQGYDYANDLAIHIRDLPSETRVYDGALTLRARTVHEYDNYAADPNHAPLVPRSNIAGLDPAWGPSRIPRGNPTATRLWLDNPSSFVTTYQQFDVAGNVVKGIDARGHATSLVYNDRFGVPDGEAGSNTPPAGLGNSKAFAFVTATVNAASQTTTTQYDYFLGRPVDAEDVAGVVTSSAYADILDRPTAVTRASNVPALKNRTTFEYNDGSRIVTTRRDRDHLDDHLLITDVRYDGLGREKESRLYEAGGNVVAVRRGYDGRGRLARVSNPFRPATQTPEWTETDYDALDRPITVSLPGSDPPAVVTTAYLGNRTTVTDPANKRRRTFSDAAGRITSVVEDPGGFNHNTTYAYDALDNLTSVSQGGQSRSFGYDSLSRLRSASNPESGGTTYVYDANGNLETRTDSRGVVTSYGYDALNRPLARSHSDGTPSVAFTYDETGVPFSTGRLVSVTNSVSATRFTEYDALGRVRRHEQTTGGVGYHFVYGYNLADDLTSQTYPSGRVVTTGYDEAGRVNAVSTPGLGVDSVGYAPHGAVEKARLGNGRWEETQFNARLQAKFIGLGSNPGARDLFDLENGYGGSTNNGNVGTQILRVAGAVFTQSYGYDALNRLSTAAETKNGQPTWNQTYHLDAFGNRAVTGWLPDPAQSPTSLTHFNPSTNRLNTTFDPDVLYDAAGNLKRDARALAFNYDAENHQTSAGTSSYAYDGEGRRVRKVVNGVATTFVYDAFGRLATEAGGPGPMGTTYLTYDHLGSVRVTTDSSGAVLARQDYLPFGESIPEAWGRTGLAGYSAASPVRQKFTGKERDAENGLDFFQARYFSGPQGRFTSADEPLIFSALEDPQTWNLYSYTGNNPLSRVDPDGHDWFHRDGFVPIWLDCTRNPDCADDAPQGWTRFMPSEPGHLRLVDYRDGTFRLGVDEDGNPTSSYTGTLGLIPVSGPVEGLLIGRFSGFLKGVSAPVSAVRVIASDPRHHTIPREILKQLPRTVANNPKVRGTRGSPNRWRIPLVLHKAIHKGAGGGLYNEAFKQKLRNLGRTPTALDVIRIRDELADQFGLTPYRP